MAPGLEPALFRDLIQIFRGEDPTAARHATVYVIPRPFALILAVPGEVMEYLGLDKASGKGYCKEA